MRLGMVGIIVEDMKKAIAFYECIGFHLNGEYDDNYVEINNSSLRISLNSKEMVTGMYGFTPESSGDKVELAFECESNEELDNVCKWINEQGYTVYKEPWYAFWGQYYAIVKDPDGNLLSLYCNK